ncbi:MAG: [protein-PII] uridylyltransferase [Pseudomonadota bacterium]
MTKIAAVPAPLDSVKLRQDLTDLTRGHGGDGSSPEVRQAVLARLKQAQDSFRGAARQQLDADGKGGRCARYLSQCQDEIIRALMDFVIHHVYRVKNPSKAERLTIVAVGGYGRGALAPHSDIDLLILLPYKMTPWGECVVEYVLYMLWDMRLKVGHATRNVDECIRLSKSDMTIRTSILEARPIWGNQDLFDTLKDRFDKEVVRHTAREFIAAKLEERDERHRNQGQSRYLVEPNVKESKGGLRDLHTLFWIAKYYFRVESGDKLVKLGVFSRSEYRRFRKCEEFLFSVRCHLHFLTGRPEERLSFDVQREIAVSLGYTEHPGQRDVERFMKHYFLIAKDVGDLTRIFCAALEAQHAKEAPRLGQMLWPFRPRIRRINDVESFVVEHDRLNVADESVFQSDPVNLLRIFKVADDLNRSFHPDALRLITRSLKLIDHDLRHSEEANSLFLEILTSPNNPERVLRRMNETGVLGKFVPEFGKIVAMTQFNMYHHYTVDEHLIRSIGVLADIEAGEEAEQHPLASKLIGSIQNRTVLYVALLLHDVAKGRPEDHSIAGARIARRIGPRLGLSQAATENVAWLIENHLVMSMTAQSRDLNDPRTIETFAALVQSQERLRLLLILTVADIKAVGPGVFNGWKGQLLRTLYSETEPILAGGHSQTPQGSAVRKSKDALRTQLADWSPGEIDTYLGRHFDPYWLRVDLDHQVAHAHMIRAADASDEGIAARAVTHAFEEITEITVVAPDHPRLLQTIAGACTLAGANIVGAQIHTMTDKMALDSITITRSFGQEADELRRAQRICAVIEGALRGSEPLPETIEPPKRFQKRRARAFRISPEILVTNDWSESFTVIEISALDRPGLLFKLTKAMSTLDLDIASAHVATFGERAVDVFYVTDLTGQKITDAPRREAIRRVLLGAIEPESAVPIRKAPGRALQARA